MVKAPSKRRKSARSKETKISRMHIAMVSPEIGPFAKTGGLADMVSALSSALEELGLRVSLIMPAYRSVLQSNFDIEETGVTLTVPVSHRKEEGTLLKTKSGKNNPVYMIRADRYFDREYLYTTPAGDYDDNAERFVFFARAVLEVLRPDPPQILHCHDWQSALSAVFLKAQPDRYPEFSSTKTLLTVHNVGYQGLFWHLDWHLLDLDARFFSPPYLEFYDKINFLKGGIVLADSITTVSPTYAEEIKAPEQGLGLEEVLKERGDSLVGILNGADYSVWNPETDPLIAKNFGPKDLSGKAVCKSELQRIFDLPQRPEVPLIGMVSRLTSQKGCDLLIESLDPMMQRELQFVLLASGEKKYEEPFKNAAAGYPNKIGVRIGFDETLAHRIEAGSDMFLMPSLYEPCGLNQMYSLKYGTIPLVRATGGLKDTVEEYDSKARIRNGFVFEIYDTSTLLDTVDRALKVFQQKRRWTALIKRAMACDFSWAQSARAYSDLYQKLLL